MIRASPEGRGSFFFKYVEEGFHLQENFRRGVYDLIDGGCMMFVVLNNDECIESEVAL